MEGEETTLTIEVTNNGDKEINLYLVYVYWYWDPGDGRAPGVIDDDTFGIDGYFTEHLGFKIIPINFVLQITVSFLVGLNSALASKAFSIYKKAGGMGGFGAVTGLFIACPTCAGTLLSTLVGAGAVGVFTIALTQLQTVFIVALATSVLGLGNVFSSLFSCLLAQRFLCRQGCV